MTGEALYYHLTHTANVTAVVGTRVYPHTPSPSQQPTYPLIVYSPQGREPHGLTTYREVVDVAAIAEGYEQALQLAELVRAALDEQSGTWGTVVVSYCSYEEGSENAKRVATKSLWIVEQSYTFVVNE